MPKAGSSTIVRNRKARYDFELLDKFEAGLVLVGSEVKSIRQARVSLTDAYGIEKNGELWLQGMQVQPYPYAHVVPHEPFRRRKLLLRQEEIRKIIQRMDQKNLSLVPVDLHLSKGRIKATVALARGKKKFEKRDKLTAKSHKKEMDHGY